MVTDTERLEKASENGGIFGQTGWRGLLSIASSSRRQRCFVPLFRSTTGRSVRCGRYKTFNLRSHY